VATTIALAQRSRPRDHVRDARRLRRRALQVRPVRPHASSRAIRAARGFFPHLPVLLSTSRNCDSDGKATLSPLDTTASSNSGHVLIAKRSAQVRGVNLASPAVTRARRVSVAARANLSTHTVQSGENLWAISVARGVSLSELKAANVKALGRGDTIYPGQRLIVPPGGKRLEVPNGYKPSTRPGTGAYESRAPTRTSSTNPANLAKKQGLGLVTAGAFFIALAVGIWMFKEEEPSPARGYGRRDAYGDDQLYDDEAGYARDEFGNVQDGRRGAADAYYDRYNRGDWPRPNGAPAGQGRNGGWPDQQQGYGNQPRGGDYSAPPQWGEGRR